MSRKPKEMNWGFLELTRGLRETNRIEAFLKSRTALKDDELGRNASMRMMMMEEYKNRNYMRSIYTNRPIW